MHNYRVVFNKKSYDGTKSYANIEPALDHKVYGVIYYGLNEPTLTYVYVAQNKWIDKKSKLKPSQVYLAKLWESKEYLPVEYQEKLKSVKVMERGEFGDCL